MGSSNNNNFGFPKTTLKGKTFYDISKLSDPKEVAAKIVNYILDAAGTGEIIEIT